MISYLDIGFDAFTERRIQPNMDDDNLDATSLAGDVYSRSSGEFTSGGSSYIPPSETEDNVGIEEKLPDKALDFSKLNIDRIYVNQSIESSNFVSGSAGWQINGAGDVEFNDGTFRGALIAGEIHIPDEDTTTNSFHVDTDGNLWIGATSTDFGLDNNNAEFYVLNTGAVRAISGNIGGWNLADGYIYNLQSGTPTAAPNDGLVLASGDEGIIVYEDTAERVRLGFLSAGVYGVRGFATNGTTVIFEFSDTRQVIGGWNFTDTVLRTGATDAASNVLIDSANSLMRLGPTTGSSITMDGANQRIRSSTYTTGVSGFTVEPGLVEAQNIIARGTLSGSVFRYDVISATGGRQVIANADALSTAMSALDASTLTIRGNVTFAVNDILVVRAQSSGGIQEEYLRVTAIGAAPTYTVTRDLAATFGVDANPAWAAGTAIVQQGESDGAAAFSGGWLDLVGEASSGNWPRVSVFQRTGVGATAFTERVRMGNLNGYLGYASDIYGFAVGSSVAGEANITFDPTNGIRIRQGTTNLITFDMAGAATLLNLTVGGSLNVLTSGNFRSGQTAYNTGTGFFMEYNGGTPRLSLGDGGVSNYLTWDGTNLVVNGLTFGGDPIFGDGSDGDVVIGVNTTLARDMFYDDLTVSATFTLTTAGYRVFVRGILTLNGTLGRPGSTPSTAGNGTDGGTGAAGGAFGTGGSAGGGATLVSGSIYGSVAGTAGIAGGNGGAGGAGAGGAGVAGAGNNAGTSVLNSLGNQNTGAGTSGVAGGSGGAGAQAAGGGGAAGGVAATNGTVTAAIASVRNLINASIMIDTGASPLTLYTGSASGAGTSGSGGGGGGGGDVGAARNGGGGGGAGGSGGNGGAGGMVLLAARTITIGAAGILTATGGNGAVGGNGGVGGQGDTSVAPAGQCGGGGGGGAGSGGRGGNGGVIVMIYQSLTNNGSITVAAGSGGIAGSVGTGGAGTNGGATGSNGTVGNSGASGVAGTTIQLSRT